MKTKKPKQVSGKSISINMFDDLVLEKIYAFYLPLPCF